MSTSVLGLVLAFIFKESLPAWPKAAQMLDPQVSWHPLEDQFGMVPLIVGSMALALGALALAWPLGLASALFTTQGHGPAWLVRPYRWVLGLLAGIPSVVFGLWGLTVLIPLVAAWRPPGASLLTGMLILGLMILPTIALTAEAAFRAVPQACLQGAHALGLNRSAITWGVLLPAARQGLLAGAVLACARALGETMAVLMVTGNVVRFPGSLFDPVRTLTANMALEMAYATSIHRASLFLGGLLLTAVVVAMALLAHRFRPGHAPT